ncbi:MAG: hypothetical protein CMB80_05270 [Flammeovirgaceae bacterium]|nr:hypothetical protein [Flammeovirgaceae bacterium]|tara:strand:+ start:694 stop:3402 length:2709 start_codon:yes stop_codon:yes gene_type:complete
MIIVFNQKINNASIFEIPNAFFSKVGAEGGYNIAARDGYQQTLHELKFAVNFINAISQGAYFFRVSAYLTDPDSPPMVNDTSPSQMPDAIKNQSNKTLQQLKMQQAFQVGFANADLSYHLSQDAIHKLISKMGVITKGLNIKLPTVRVVELLSPQGLQNSIKAGEYINMTAQVAHVDEHNTSEDKKYFKSLCYSAILDGQDPATAFSYSFPIDPAQARFQRLIPSSIIHTKQLRNRGNFPIDSLQVRSHSSNIKVATSVGFGWPFNGALSALRVRSTNLATSNPGVLIQRIATHLSAVFNLPIKFRFPASLNPDKIYFTFEAIGLMGNVITATTKNAQYMEANMHIESVLDPPVINVERIERNTIKITVSQTDPLANLVRVYRKAIDLDEYQYAGDKYNTWKMVGAVSSTPNREGVMYDATYQGRSVIYRAVAENTYGKMSQEFGSAASHAVAVSKSVTYDVPLPKQRYHDVQDAVISVAKGSGGVIVKIQQLKAPLAISFYVTVADVSAALPKNDPRKVYNKPTNVSYILDSDKGRVVSTDLVSRAPISFLHSKKSLIHGHSYQYTVHFKNRDGTITEARSTAYYKFSALDDVNMKLDVSPPIVNSQGPNGSVTFTTKASFTNDGLQTVIKMLQKNGTYSLFAKDVKANLALLNPLLKINITRIDLSNGSEFNFGPRSFGNFTDNGVNTPQGVIPLKSGRKYRYEFRLLNALIFSFLPGSNSPAVNDVSFVKYKKKISKYLNVKTSKDATISSWAFISSGDKSATPTVAEIFEEGETSISIIKEVFIPVPKPSTPGIYGLAVGWSGIEQNIMITWNCSSPGDVDHFQVFAKYAGVVAVVGVVHAFKQGYGFSYHDKKLSGVVGNRAYAVRAVYNDYTPGQISDYISISIKNSLNMLEKVSG